MTFNENANVGGNKARRRGRTAAVAGGGVGIVGIAVLLISMFTGVDLTGIVGGGGGQQEQTGGSEIANCETGADANARDDCRLAAASLAIDQFWAENVEGYREPELIIVDVETGTQCGTASNATGPFYCPPEENVYVDPTFFSLLRERFDATAGPLAQLYVLAHEYGHHVQNITGIMQHPDNGTGPDSNGVRTELQADCFAGAWVAAMTQQEDEAGVPFLEPPTRQQIADALNAAASVGDDHIQQAAGGAINPEGWTHGSSEMRQRWFDEGYDGGIQACDTFAVPEQPMTHTDALYPPIEPYESGMLLVGDGHRVYWECSGNPDGKPVVFLHGGPGAGTSVWHRRFFDPEKYRIVLFDQRGCGRSTPHAAGVDADLRHNTTWHLVGDIELLRKNLGISRWQVFGGSWGSALALAYAQAHPGSVTELVLRGIFTLRRHELEWFYEGGAEAIFPDLWQDFVAPIPVLERSRLIDAYHRRLSDPDPAVHVPAAVAWTTWEASTLTLRPDPELVATMAEPQTATAFARIENHYFVHGGWFREGQLIEGAGGLADIPAVIVQGRYDVCTPMMTAWDLHRAWPEAEFVVVDDAGHSATEPGIAAALVAATDRFAA